MQVILLERIARLGGVGDTVKVKDGFGRNFLLPQKKALRATKENVAYFESKRSVLEKQNNDAKAAAEKKAKDLGNLSVSIIRQASDDGKLYGSVSVRDVSDALVEAGHEIERRLIDLNSAIKSLGAYEAVIHFHPEVPVKLTINVARNADSLLAQELEAKPQAEEAIEADDEQETTAESDSDEA
jgi:large subunit ribosomal protein L9